MSSLTIGRMQIGIPMQWYEQVGDPITNLGGAIVPAPRTALRHAVTQPTFAADGNTDTVAARFILRRQFRSMLNNTPLKLQGYIYLLHSDDPEQNGWYVPDQGQFTDGDGASGVATGWWKLDNVNWAPLGHPRTNREARNIWMKPLLGGLYPRDILGLIYLTDFSWAVPIQLSVFPNGATQIMNTVTGARALQVALPTGRDGGTAQLVAGLSDLATLSYERPESALNLSDVIAYDREGAGDAPTTGPGPTWVEAYGPDFPWNWTTGGANDTPVLDNGLVRVRYDATVGKPGFRVDVWNGAAYVEQGKAVIQRVADAASYCDTWVSAGLFTDNGYTPDRATVEVVLASSVDSSSRERVFITMQRGEPGVTFEVYPAPKSEGTSADATIAWCLPVDTNDSACKINATGAPPAAGTGFNASSAGLSGAIPSTSFGGVTFASGENWIAVLRCSATATVTAYQHNLVVVQGGLGAESLPATVGYGVTTNTVYIGTITSGLGYIQTQLSFAATEAQQVQEGESMVLGSGTLSTADAAASNGYAASATRTSDANAHVTTATWPNGFDGTFRVFVRARVSASTGHLYAAAAGSTTGATQTFTATSYAWYDLGDIVAVNSTLSIHAWLSASATIYVDRMEAYLVNDQARTGATYSGARDQGLAALYDNRQLGAVVSR